MRAATILVALGLVLCASILPARASVFYDVTLDPRYMSKRGVQLRSDFRYLLPTSEGTLGFEYLPNDDKADRTRRYVKFNHDTVSVPSVFFKAPASREPSAVSSENFMSPQ